MSRKSRRQSGTTLTLEEELENLRNDVGVLRRSVESKSAAVTILRSELEKCQRERDKFKGLAEHSPSLASRSSFKASALTYPEVGRSAMLSPSEGTLAQLLSQSKQENKTLRLECTELRCKLHDAQADSKVLREELQRRDGCGPGRRASKVSTAASSQLAYQEREQFINQMETLSAKCLALEGDVRGLVEEREELIKERDSTAHKLHRLNHILNVLMNNSSEDIPKRTVDLDAIITENRYLQERLKNSEDEKKQARISASKYKAIIEKQRSPGATKLGGRSDGLIVTPKQVGELLQEYKGEMDGAAEGDVRSLCVALVDAINQRSGALKTQRRANKVLVNRIVELERRLTFSGRSNDTTDTEEQVCFISSSAKLMEGYVPPSGPAPNFSPQILDDPHILQLIQQKQMKRDQEQISPSKESDTSVANSPVINGNSTDQVQNKNLDQNEAKDENVNAQSISPQRLNRRRRYSYEKACGDENLRLSFTEANEVYDYDFENGCIKVYDSPEFTKTVEDVLNSTSTLESEGGSEVSDQDQIVQTNGIHDSNCITESTEAVVEIVENPEEENKTDSRDTSKCQTSKCSDTNRNHKDPSANSETNPERNCVSHVTASKTENYMQKGRVPISAMTDRPLQPCNPYLATLEPSCNHMGEDLEEIVPIDLLDSYIQEVKAKQQKSKANGTDKKEYLEKDQRSPVKSDSNLEGAQSNETKAENIQEEEKNARTKMTSQKNNKPCKDKMNGIEATNMSNDVSREIGKLDDDNDIVKAVSNLGVKESMEGEVNGKTEEVNKCDLKSTNRSSEEGIEVEKNTTSELGESRNGALTSNSELQTIGENDKLDDNGVRDKGEIEVEDNVTCGLEENRNDSLNGDSESKMKGENDKLDDDHVPNEVMEREEECGIKSGTDDDEMKLCESSNIVKEASSELESDAVSGEYCEYKLNANELGTNDELVLEENESTRSSNCTETESCKESEKTEQENVIKNLEPVTAEEEKDHEKEMPQKSSEELPTETEAPHKDVPVTEGEKQFSRNTKSSCLNGEDLFNSVESQITCLKKDTLDLDLGKSHLEDDDNDDNSFDLEMSDYDSDNDNLDETLLEWQQEFRKMDPKAAKKLPSPAHKVHKPKDTSQPKAKLLDGMGAKGQSNKDGNDLSPALEALLQKAVGLAAENGIDCA
ncbi:uncharacterized protein LOC143040022 [Oratosquilla oratoria]|uniref:uncharacterized protein LOC143040022 n=1 Tax=Oratosquilla oratoria TaxID=337810 RepID=UPI003F763945